MILHRTIATLGLCLLAGLATAAEPPADLSVAVLEAEVSLEVTPTQRDALAGALDAVLSASLAGRKGLTVVDRQALEAVLAEKALDAEPLRRLRAAGVLVCPSVQPLDARHPENDDVVVCIEAVAAQTGQVLAEVRVAAKVVAGQWQGPPLAAEVLDVFWVDLARAAASRPSVSLVEVADGRLVSTLTRMQWMVDALVDSLRAGVARQPGLTLLIPRHPASTKEERLLRVMGLAEADPADATAGLTAAPSVHIRLELTEEVGRNIEYEKTPVAIKLTVQAHGRPAVEQTVRGQAADYDALRDQAEAWLAGELRRHAAPGAPVGDDEYCRTLAKEELAAARQAEKLCHGWYATGSDVRYFDQAPRARVLARALRAAHLDPTCEEAARLVVLGIDSQYAARGRAGNDACCDRVIQEGLRYLSRFPKAAKADEVRSKVAGVAYGKLSDLRRGTGWLDKPHDPEIYRYATPSLLNLDDDVRRQTEINLWAAANTISEAVFVHCPADRLADEHAKWRDFWQKNVVPLPGDMPPWEFVEIGYHVRNKDVAALRRNLTALAAKYPQTHAKIWWGTRIWPEGGAWERGKPCWKVRLGLFLKPCGDPEWQTWEPPFKSAAYGWDALAYDKFLRTHNPRMRGIEGSGDGIPLPADLVDLAWDDPGDAEAVRRQGLQPLLSAGGFLWLATPPRSKDSSAQARLFLVPLAALLRPAGAGGAVRPLRLHWPADEAAAADADRSTAVRSWTAGHEAGSTIVWIGTAGHGLARFELQDGGRWQGKWYTTQTGLPGDDVLSVAPCLYDGKPRLLAMSQPSMKDMPSSQAAEKFLWALDGASGEITLIASTKDWWPYKHWWPNYTQAVLAWRDGTKIPLRDYTGVDFPTLDAKNIAGVGRSGKRPDSSGGDVRLTRDGDVTRLWQVGKGNLLELTPQLNPRPGQVNLSPITGYLMYRSPKSPRDGIAVMPYNGEAWWTMPRGPEFDVLCTTSSPTTFWCAAASETDVLLRGARQLIAYRPASKAPAEDNDQWFGPWQLPDRTATRSATFLEGRLWIATTDGSLYRVDPEAAIRQAQAARAARSTAQWRRDCGTRLAEAPWPTPVRAHLSLGDWDRALAALARQKEAVGPAGQDLATGGAVAADLVLWEALICASKGDYELAERLYSQLLAAEQVEPCAKAEALANLINVRHAAGRWDAVQEAVDRFKSQFGDATAPFGNRRQLKWFLDDASKHMTTAPAAPQAAVPVKSATE